MVLQIDNNILNFNKKELRSLVEKIPHNHVVLVRDLFCEKEDLFSFLNKIGQSQIREGGFFYSDKDFPTLSRVTNHLDVNQNSTGLFSDKALSWHSNGSVRKDNDEITLILYCVDPGDSNHGITSFCDMKAAYNDLPAELKKLSEKIDVRHSFKTFIGESPSIHPFEVGYAMDSASEEYEIFSGSLKNKNGSTSFAADIEKIYKPLVRTHPWTGDKSLYFLPSQITEWRHRDHINFDSLSLWEKLCQHCFQEKYIYHHRWKAGDLIFNDQSNYVHKRSPTKGERLLWRFCINNTILEIET